MKAKTFPHGIHPPEDKESTAEKELAFLSPPEKVVIPLHQHFGNPAEALVKKGEDVCLGQKIGESVSLFSASVHASVSGKVVSVDGHNHPLGKPVLSITLSNDGEDRIHPDSKETEDPFSLDPDTIRQRVKDAGVVGLGGAAFPTSVKITPPKGKPIDTVIINGCECEPLLTADYRLMMEYPEEILKGAELVRIATGADRILVGIEDNKKKAFELLQNKAASYSADVFLVKTKYPQGAEKNLIFALLGREVPRGGLPFDVGVVVQNVGTAKAVWDAVKKGQPLYERALTVAGDGIKMPKNLIARIGTPFQAVIDFCGGLAEDVNTIIMGGPMMGLSQWALDTPVIKGTSGILAWSSAKPAEEFACIRCSRCVQHCPMGLVPTQLMKYIRYGQLPEAEKWGALDCVECGSCEYSCPAKIPLVHWIRLGKNQIVSQKRKKSAQ
jgi:electron transport complex protein RnfC